ncbi:MAG: UDP-glucose 4-epimerase [Cyanobium sp. CACIAM 14]|nr:MAG: UDP-glucose 4-epimerase [Cyanobium sp. CACIAM 14]
MITGGAGFIGSHACLVLIEAGHTAVVIDNFQNSRPEAIRRVAEICQLSPCAASAHPSWQCSRGDVRLILVHGDIRNPSDLEAAFEAFLRSNSPHGQARVDAVMHFAGLKAVGDSIRNPLSYWSVNVEGSRTLLASMRSHQCQTIVFSSTAALYGLPELLPINEEARVQPANPYGRTKAAVEQMLADIAESEPGWRIARLRYFNPVGAHPSGRIGEDPSGIPSNLFPLITQAAMGIQPYVQIYGSDWDTTDGTGIRDFIHVMDLAEGHKVALEVLLSEPEQIMTLNLGSGRGHSVLDMIHAFERINGCRVPYRFAPRRAGDVAISVADPSRARHRLGWCTRRSLEDICRDGWAWRQQNRNGYGAEP